MLRLNLMRLSPTLNNALRQKLKVVAFERIGIRQVTRRHAWLVTLDIFAHDHTAIVAIVPTRFKPHAPHDTTFTSSRLRSPQIRFRESYVWGLLGQHDQIDGRRLEDPDTFYRRWFGSRGRAHEGPSGLARDLVSAGDSAL